MEECLSNIIQGKVANIPVYDFKLNSRVVDKYRTVYPNQVDVVLFEGILTFYNPKVRIHTCLNVKSVLHSIIILLRFAICLT